jgi:hypothetical protein
MAQTPHPYTTPAQDSEEEDDEEEEEEDEEGTDGALPMAPSVVAAARLAAVTTAAAAAAAAQASEHQRHFAHMLQMAAAGGAAGGLTAGVAPAADAAAAAAGTSSPAAAAASSASAVALSGEAKRKGKWTVEQDQKLRETVAAHGGKNWKRIAAVAFGTSKSDVQCLHRWQKVHTTQHREGDDSRAERDRMAHSSFCLFADLRVCVGVGSSFGEGSLEGGGRRIDSNSRRTARR